MPERPPIVCYGSYDYWSGTRGSPLQLVEAAHRLGHPVLWINNIGMNMPRARRRRGLARRVWQRLRSWSRWLRTIRPGFHVLAPVALPLFGNKRLERWTDRWLRFQIRLVLRHLGFEDAVALVCIPSFGNVAPNLPHRALVYYYTDKYDAYRDITAHTAIQERDRRLLEAADLVLCASRLLEEEARRRHPAVIYFPHAVQEDMFRATLTAETVEPDDLAPIPHPRVGYFGSLTDSNDMSLVAYCARHDPSLQFVMIGRRLAAYPELAGLPNVHFLGPKQHEEIPLYGKYLDVGIMNWKMTDWIRHSSPVKTREYLALGLPVVSVPIAEVEMEYADLVTVAADGPSFLDAIHRALAQDDAAARDRRRERVRGDSWEQRVDLLFRSLEEVARGA